MARGPSTSAIHGDDGVGDAGDMAPPIRPSTTYVRGGAYGYRRAGHETVQRLEAVVGGLEGGEAVVYPSGMAAVAAVLKHLAPRRVVLPSEVYHGVAEYAAAEAGRGTFELVRSGLPGRGDVSWVESPSNPTVRVTDIPAAARAARRAGASIVVDATFATPALQRTLGLGADFVVHSSTKFIGGHSDASGGVVVTADGEQAESLRAARSREGLVPGAFETWLTLRGIRTLPLRVRRQSETALAIARHLAAGPYPVFYPGLESDPGHEVAARQMVAFGGVLSVDFGDAATADGLVAALRLFKDATSLGGGESLAERRALSDPATAPGLVRFSIGLEDSADLIGDLEGALSALDALGTA